MEKRVFDQTKTQELTEYDLSLGKLVADRLVICRHEAVAAKTAEEIAADLSAQGKTVVQIDGKWYEVTATYPNGGKDIKNIEAIAGKEAYDEYEDIYVYVPYSEVELSVIAANKAISEAKAYLAGTDYIVLKIAEAQAEGDTAQVAALQAEYAEQLAKRKQARETVNAGEARVRKLAENI